MTYFVSLKFTALIIGLLYLLSHLPGALAPTWAARLLRPLPRNYPLGVTLMLAATLWFVVLTGLMDLGELSNMRMQLMTVWGIAGILVVIFVRGFLAVRGLGCLLLLAAALMLDAAFLVQIHSRYVVTILAYFWAMSGMVLVYSPHVGRDMMEYVVTSSRRIQLFAWPGALFGLLLIFLAIFIYP